MPVEQAFTLLVQVNNNYGVREFFLNDFDGLHMRLYQLDRIIQVKYNCFFEVVEFFKFHCNHKLK